MTTPTKILHVFKTYFPDTHGGVEQVIKSICTSTAPLGFKNSIVTLSPHPGTEIVDNTAIIRHPRNLNIASCPMGIKFARQFSTHASEADIIHYHFPWPFAELLHILKKIKKPSIVTYHSDIVRQRTLKKFYDPIMKRFLSSVDRIVPTSENYLGSSKDLKPFQHKCEVIPIGIDINDLPKPTETVVNQWEKKVGNKFIFFIGVFRYYKGLHVLLKAAQGIDTPIVIAGDGPLVNSLKSEAKQLKLNHVHFPGKISDADKAALLQLCRAVVLPSHLRSEAYGVSLLEGLASGKPLISTDIGTGTSFVNEHDVTGFVVPANDPHELQKAIIRLHTDKDLALKMGKAAKLRYEKYFTADRMGEAYVKLYDKLVQKN